MIYIRFHQAENEGIKYKIRWMQAGIYRMQVGEGKKNFALIAKFSQ